MNHLESLEQQPHDPDEGTGRRCAARSEELDVGCYRRADHDRRGHPWHYAVKNYDLEKRTGEWWRWRDE